MYNGKAKAGVLLWGNAEASRPGRASLLQKIPHLLFQRALVSALALAAVPAAAGPSHRVIAIPGIPSQGYNNVFPADINDHGVVGMLSRLPGYVPVRAFLWDGVHPTLDLGDLGEIVVDGQFGCCGNFVQRWP